MTIDGNTLGIILGLVALGSTGATLVGLVIKMRATGERNTEDIADLKRYVREQVAELKADYAEDVRILHDRVNERKAEMQRHIELSNEVHGVLATLTEAMNAIRERLGRIEDKIDRQPKQE